MITHLPTQSAERRYLWAVMLPTILVLAVLTIGVGKEAYSYHQLQTQFGELSKDQRPSLSTVWHHEANQADINDEQVHQTRLLLAGNELRRRLQSFTNSNEIPQHRLVELGISWPGVGVAKQIRDAAEPILQQMLKIDVQQSATDFRFVAIGLVQNNLSIAVYEDDHQQALEALKQLSQVVQPNRSEWIQPTRYFDKYDEAIRRTLEVGFWQTADQVRELRLQLDSVPIPSFPSQQQRDLKAIARAAFEIADRKDMEWAYSRSMYPFGVPYEAQWYCLNPERQAQATPTSKFLEHAVQLMSKSDIGGGLNEMTILGAPYADLRDYQIGWLHGKDESRVLSLAMHEYRRLTTDVLLAIKQFQLEHKRWPTHLGELAKVGIYLDDLRIDKRDLLKYERDPGGQFATVWRYQALNGLVADQQHDRSLTIEHHVH